MTTAHGRARRSTTSAVRSGSTIRLGHDSAGKGRLDKPRNRGVCAPRKNKESQRICTTRIEQACSHPSHGTAAFPHLKTLARPGKYVPYWLRGKHVATVRHTGRAVALLRRLMNVPDRAFERALGMSPATLAEYAEAATRRPADLQETAPGQPQPMFNFILGSISRGRQSGSQKRNSPRPARPRVGKGGA
jgi:hypothetical protein